jgi:hypothetical protein
MAPVKSRQTPRLRERQNQREHEKGRYPGSYQDEENANLKKPQRKVEAGEWETCSGENYVTINF